MEPRILLSASAFSIIRLILSRLPLWSHRTSYL
ncbi:LEPR-XLL domain-containing protein [Blautia pseudococcoides]|uniref:Uncharacterized protein n=1 Tax=Blautia pseudococcoides TaxID=1796616 RepID=A0A1V0QES2_9FIRM|nr:hypothetical protein A4V09_24100 [Blautia pseudococcoides]ASU29253.1 LEPR-XLL domain-containing protein [Blautia pseudococcoides]QQQ94020.1 LEPR-XLL domain-containing protein [Blautia pseudococcoides]